MPNALSRRFVRALVAVALAGSVAVVAATPAQAARRTDVMQNAANYARQQGYHVGIAVLDTRTGVFRGSGDYTGTYASESLIKVFIATRLLLAGRMHGSTAARAWKMITQSDDAIASSFYGSVGGDGLVSWMAQHYHVSHLGYAPSRAGWWGNTHLHPDGLAHLYAKLKVDRRVAPWLLNAMHHATHYGSDGTYQFFGIPSATSGAAIKQGWGNDYEIGSSADFNSTGFVNGDRYAMVILARGPSSTYGSQIGSLLTGVARRLMPGGHFPDGVPGVSGLSRHFGITAGGQSVTINGWGFTNVSKVFFGYQHPARSFRVVSPTQIVAVTPAHRKIRSWVQVVTTHGTTRLSPATTFYFDFQPTVTSLTSTIGSSSGGNWITLKGSGFTLVRQIMFGPIPATRWQWISRGQLNVKVPKHFAGQSYVTVTTKYGQSPHLAADLYRFVDPARITKVTPQQDGSVLVTGSGYFGSLTVTFNGQRAAQWRRFDSTRLAATPQSGAATSGTISVDTSFGAPATARYALAK